MVRSKTAAQQMRDRAREAILEGALAVFGEKGFGGATTAEVAVRAGVSKGLVFNYFPTKDALLEALIERTLGEALAYWEEAEWSGPAAEQLRRILDIGVERVLANTPFYRLYFSLVLQPGGSEAVDRAVARLMPRLMAYFARTERLMAELGSAAPALDAKIFQFALNGFVQAIAAQAGLARQPDIMPIDELKARLLGRFLPRQETKR